MWSDTARGRREKGGAPSDSNGRPGAPSGTFTDSTEILQQMSEGELPDSLQLGITDDGDFEFSFETGE